MPTTLVTGASRGIGLEFATQYLRDGWRVIGTVRDTGSADRLRRIGAEAHVLDLRDPDAAAALAQRLSGTAIDVLIANAGVYEGFDARLAQLGAGSIVDGFAVDAVAPLLLAKAFREHVIASAERRMVAITSKLATSHANVGHIVYRSSKAALNTAWRALALEEPAIVALLLRPGRVATRMSPGADLSARDSVAGMRAVIARAGPPESGRCFDYLGTEHPA